MRDWSQKFLSGWQYILRREFIQLLVGVFHFSARAAIAKRDRGAGPENTHTSTRVAVTHGPILGRPGAHEMGIWARTSEPGSFRVRYGEKLELVSAPVMTELEHDNAAHILLTNLQANTRYQYQVFANEEEIGRPELRGSFLTLPDAAEFREPTHNPTGLFNFSFELGCCNNQNTRWYGNAEQPVFKTMLERLKDHIHFAILNGDWIYEEKRDYTAAQWLNQVGKAERDVPKVVAIAPLLVGVWENYKLYLERGKNLSRWHREIPSFFTFDDHDLLNDLYGAGSLGLRSRRAVFRDIGVQAWNDYVGWSDPVVSRGIHFGRAELKSGSDVLTDTAGDLTRIDVERSANLHVHWGGTALDVDEPDGESGDPNAGVYEVVEVLDSRRLRIRPPARANTTSSYSIGQLSYSRFQVSNCDFYLLDTRSYRQMHDVHQRRQPVSLLGQRQKSWLMKGMQTSNADFFFLVSSVNFMIPHVGAGGIVKTDENKDEAWTVFLDEREELIQFFQGLERPVFVLTGDLHNSFAVRITDRIWEFASAPHSSLNHPASSEGNRPPNGRFDSYGRECEIRWSSYVMDDVPPALRLRPIYCVVQVNNVFNSPRDRGKNRWIVFPHPQVIFQYYDGITGELLYAEPILSTRMVGSRRP